MASTFLLGGTGMVGSQILTLLKSSPQITSIDILARRSLPTTDPKIHPFLSPTLSEWPSHLSTLKPFPQIYFCAFATTRGAAGGFKQQYEIEHDLNISLARTAKEGGCKVFVLISSSGASTKSMFGYTKMKGEIEEHVKDLGFEHTVIIRPGLIAGRREESRPTEAVLRKVADWMGGIHPGLKNVWAQDKDVIAKAALKAGLMASNGEVKEKVWVVGQGDIVRLGMTEWKE